jgi:hypothetical protein
MHFEDYVVLLYDTEKLNIKIQDVLLVAFAVTIFSMWMIMGLMLPRYNGEQCECLHQALKVSNGTEYFTVDYALFCPMYNGYMIEVSEGRYDTYEIAYTAMYEIKYETVPCCIKDGELYNKKCKRTFFDIAWKILMPAILLGITLFALMVYSAIRVSRIHPKT